jgi:hypothetical protein
MCLDRAEVDRTSRVYRPFSGQRRATAPDQMILSNPVPNPNPAERPR